MGVESADYKGKVQRKRRMASEWAENEEAEVPEMEQGDMWKDVRTNGLFGVTEGLMRPRMNRLPWRRVNVGLFVHADT